MKKFKGLIEEGLEGLQDPVGRMQSDKEFGTGNNGSIGT